MKIKIIATPAGEAPEWVRESWIGLELPADIALGVRRRIGILSQEPVEPISGYRVKTSVALAILERANPEAADWFRRNMSPVSIALNQLVFDYAVCEEISDN